MKDVPVGWAIRFATDGVKPALVERWTLYLATPTLSVAAPQLSTAWPSPPAALSVPGAPGGTASGALIGVVMSLWISAAVSARL